jgi:hypothetical protein
MHNRNGAPMAESLALRLSTPLAPAKRGLAEVFDALTSTLSTASLPAVLPCVCAESADHFRQSIPTSASLRCFDLAEVGSPPGMTW